jgi:hypothetical protein
MSVIGSALGVATLVAVVFGMVLLVVDLADVAMCFPLFHSLLIFDNHITYPQNSLGGLDDINI